MRKHTSGGLAICFSACDDSQMAVDTSVKIFCFFHCFLFLPYKNSMWKLIHYLNFDMQAFRKGMQGVMTHLFIKAIKDNPDITYGGILKKVKEGIAVINQKSRYPRVFNWSRRRNILQVSSFLIH